ncbi:polysaccharide biosynthesis C-terminal domain-containing protein [Anaerococcus sp.]|uniref:polysaccharide biosynthesis C-terminal domain-containing protein n=1 Tax=Anaerococcus sp. TaxID=1872515 RepID=UPI0039675892
MLIMIIESLSNIILDYIFIFTMNMGIFGAILATCFSLIILLIMALHYIFKRKNNFHIQDKLGK